MSDSNVVVPPTNGTGIVTFDRGHHGHGHHDLHHSADWAQDFARTGERVIHDLSVSDRFRAQEVRDVLGCTEANGVRNLVSTKDVHLAVECGNGTIRREMECMRREIEERVRNDGDRTRELIRDMEAKALAVQLADTKAELAALKALCLPAAAR